MRLILAAGLAATLPLAAPLPALAQSAELDQMQQGLTMLETTVGQQLRTYGIEADPQELSLSQLALIHGILSSSDNDATKGQRIEAALRR